jgi:hypothetical protein
MINYTKDINANYGSPYVEVEENTDGATKANNGKYYLTKEQIESRFTDGDFHLTYLADAEFIEPTPIVWSKEAHLQEINDLHEAEFKRRLSDANYVAEWELNAVLTDSENEYFDEAVLIINYWWNGWDAIKAYSETVTEENFIDPQTFVDNL